MLVSNPPQNPGLRRLGPRIAGLGIGDTFDPTSATAPPPVNGLDLPSHLTLDLYAEPGCHHLSILHPRIHESCPGTGFARVAKINAILVSGHGGDCDA